MKQGEPFNPHGLFTGVFVPDAILSCKSLSSTEKLVLCRLYRYAHKKGYAYVTHAQLAHEFNLSKRQVIRVLANLESQKFIETKHQSGSHNIFYLLFHEILTPQKPIDVGAEFDETQLGGSDIDVTGGVTLMSPPSSFDNISNLKHNIKHKKNIKKDLELEEIPPHLDTAEFKQAWQEFAEYRRECKRPLTRSGKQRLLKKLESVSVECAIAALNESIEKSWIGVFPKIENEPAWYTEAKKVKQSGEF